MKVFRHLATGATIALTLGAGIARAATTVRYAGYRTALDPGETLLTDFRDPTALPPGFALFGTAAFMTGTSSDGAAPAIDARSRDPGQYLSMEANEFETLTTPALEKISFYIGSIDTYNTLTFTFENLSKQVFTGAQLANIAHAVADGDQQSSATNGRFTFTFGAPITQVRFDSSGNSLEVANVAAVMPKGAGQGASAVPEPSTWAMMLIGLAGLGATLRRWRPVHRPEAARWSSDPVKAPKCNSRATRLIRKSPTPQ